MPEPRDPAKEIVEMDLGEYADIGLERCNTCDAQTVLALMICKRCKGVTVYGL